ncbi:HNH endonuclease [Sphingomonas sanxanigenens DSM 19645 = NX02]|uniref:HNH endonuclease n=1 Tax=Sphingomonas sanxanigenens DSM 19645 = NX02 TaxID=1123269 RepID=W0A5V6_9SPHN|nr:HNH endonuclease [Sphingomonas sanxanigenens DSM 19645 = NX02]
MHLGGRQKLVQSTSGKPQHDSWYKTARWQRRRAAQLRDEPLCRMCQGEGRITAATIADHVIPHRGDPVLFWQGELQSLCKPHHDRDKQRIERGGKPRQAIGLDGWPV